MGANKVCMNKMEKKTSKGHPSRRANSLRLINPMIEISPLICD